MLVKWIVKLPGLAGCGKNRCWVGPGFIDDCKTNVRVSLFRANFEKCFVSGHDFSRAEKGQ